MLSKPRAGIYIHFPFCHYKCGFCDFYSGCFPYDGNYFNWVIQEIECYNISALQEQYHFNTLYLGGGTPSIAESKDLERLFNFLENKGLLSSLEEITIEGNPESISYEKLKFYKELGFNRVSLGIQSLTESILKKIGRLATIKQNIQSIEWVSELFSNYTLDLLYGIPEQDLCQELFSYMTFQPPHISAYHLTLYEGTQFYKYKEKWMTTDDEFVQSYQMVHDFLVLSGYNHYEISNFTLHDIYQSQHNNHYWKRNAYLGLGAGASGFLNEVRYTNHKLKNYYNSMTDKHKPIETKEILEQREIFLENFLLKLRIKEYISLKEVCDILNSQKVHMKILEYFSVLSDKGLINLDLDKKEVIPNIQTWLFTDRIFKDLDSLIGDDVYEV